MIKVLSNFAKKGKNRWCYLTVMAVVVLVSIGLIHRHIRKESEDVSRQLVIEARTNYDNSDEFKKQDKYTYLTYHPYIYMWLLARYAYCSYLPVEDSLWISKCYEDRYPLKMSDIVLAIDGEPIVPYLKKRMEWVDQSEEVPSHINPQRIVVTKKEGTGMRNVVVKLSH